MSPPKKPTPDTPLFNLGDIVKLRYEKESAGMIVGIVYRLGGGIQLLVNWHEVAEERVQYENELVLDESFDA